MKRETRKPKKLRKMAALTLALVATMLGFNLSNVAGAATYDNINDLTTLNSFIGQSTVTKGTLGSSFKTDGDIGDITGNGLTLDGKGYYLDGSNGATPAVATYSGFNIGNAITSFVLKNVTMQNFKNNDNGGAIFNKGTLTVSKGTFSNNTATVDGGAIYNAAGATMDITGATTFTGNYTENTKDNFGGAIYNAGTITNIGTTDNKATFTGNGIKNYGTDDAAIVTQKGGAIYNTGTITNIYADFTNNATNLYGGAIYNISKGTIKYLEGTFDSNYIVGGESMAPFGGAIGNYAVIENLANSTFTHNSVTSEKKTPEGGAIYNKGTINFSGTNIFGGDDVSLGNYVKSTSSDAKGGAIYNEKTITGLEGATFKNNYAQSTESQAYGGAIYNKNSAATITIKNSTFASNYADAAKTGAYSAEGGAIYSDSGSITLDTNTFEYNRVNGSQACGGALFLKGSSSSVNFLGTNTFTGNYAESTGDGKDAKGGAIYSNSTINSLTANFTGNYAKSTSGNALGGAIYHNSGKTIGSIAGTFDGNYAETSDTNKKAQGGAIYNAGTITNIGTSDNQAIFKYNGIKLEELKTQEGGAIYNTGKITNIYADFDHNAATDNGGAICNNGTITSITGNFKDNHADQHGGAIYNTKTISEISDTTFTNNVATQNGGAIANEGTITNIYADFTGNSATFGGAIISNLDSGSTGTTATISKISGNFTNNSAGDSGGAIYNGGNASGKTTTIENITDTVFSSNQASEHGGAIYNSGAHGGVATINLKDVIFKNNYISTDGGKTITSYNDIHNYTEDSGVATVNINGNVSMTGGITGNGTTNINADGTLTLNHMIDNDGTDHGLATLTQSVVNINGGTLSIQNGVAGDVIDLKTTAPLTVAAGNTANFQIDVSSPTSGNYCVTDYFIFNNDTPVAGSIKLSNINLLDDLKLENRIVWAKSSANTGLSAVTWAGHDSTGTLYSATQDNFYTFANDGIGVVEVTNKEAISTLDLPSVVQATGTNEKYEKIWNYTLTEDKMLTSALGNLGGTGRELIITGGDGDSQTLNGGNNAGITVQSGQTFAMNNVEMKNFRNSDNYGGAILNNGTISYIRANFTDNTTDYEGQISSNTYSHGGAIANYGEINTITGTFKNNSVNSNADQLNGGAICNYLDATINSINADFEGNTVSGGVESVQGGAIATFGNIKTILGSFKNNSTSSAATDVNGGAIAAMIELKSIDATFEGNFAKSTSSSEDATASGGAIAASVRGVNVTGTFTGNYAKANAGKAQGGAIYNTNYNDGNGTAYSGVMNISNATFTGNYAEGATANGGAIWNDGAMTISDSTFSGNTANGKPNDIHNEGDLTFVGTNSLEGGITGTGATTIGNTSGTATNVTLGNNATLQQQEVILNHNATLALGTKSAAEFVTNVGIFTVNGCTLSLQNGSIDKFSFNNLVLNDDLDMLVDADLAGIGKMDTVEAYNVSGAGKINVSNIRLLSDMDDVLTGVDLTFTSTLQDRIVYTGEKQIAYSPIYKYDVTYDKMTGSFGFTKHGGSDPYTPAILASSVGAQVGAYLTQINTYEQAFGNMDMLMNLTSAERQAIKYANKYASLNTQGMTYSPTMIPEEQRGMYFRPFATFEKVGLSGGPRVENTAYGALIGGDSDLIELSHGWDMTWGAYVGYNGSHQGYDGVGIYQNGGTLGVNAAWYKGNFFTGLTANVGASVAEASSIFGNENFTMLMTGIASKSGYNWELFNSKFIIQPSFLISYSFVHTFDYTNAAGIKMTSSPLNAIQIVPGLKFIGNLPHGWQPYASVQMIWNIMDNTKFKADNVNLPQLSVDPYVQYGVGLQKRWGDRFTGFGQVMLRNGGRTGVLLNAGFRWAIGKDSSKIDENLKSSTIPQRKTQVKLSAMK